MKIFVTSGMGAQGGAIAQELIDSEHDVVTLTRSSDNTGTEKGLTILEGDLANKGSIVNGLKGAEVAVFTFPLIFDLDLAKAYTSNFIAAAKEEGTKLIVFNAGFDLPKSETGLVAMDIKVAIKALLDASGLNVITLMPDVYIDNLAAPWSIPVIVNDGVLPYPVASGQKIPWISHVDLAKYVASAAEKPELAGKTLPIGGNLFAGEEIAAAIADKIEKPVHFVGVAPDDFEKQLAPGFGDLAAKEISNLYRYVAQNHTDFVSKAFKETQEILNVTPQTLGDWVNSVNWNN